MRKLFHRRHDEEGRSRNDSSATNPKLSEDDRHPVGLELLYSSTDSMIDIIAVHGLNGHRLRTWTVGETLWLRDFLPTKIPRARIWTWGYDSRTHTKSHTDHLGTKTLYDHGRALVSDLVRARRDSGTTDRPMIFIAHSLGGIVVKNALLHSDRARQGHLEEERSIKLSTFGIVFLGTPHQGGQGVSFGKLLLDIAKVQGKSSDSLLKHLAEHSELLQQQLSQFISISRDFDMIFVYETKPTPAPVFGGVAQVIVPKWSAVVPGTPDAVEIGIDEDHIRMTKFATEYDEGYRALLSELSYMTEKATRKVKANWLMEKQLKHGCHYPVELTFIYRQV